MLQAAHKKRAVLGWGIALAAAFFLNISLFGLMPGLIQQVPAPLEDMEVLKNVQVVRIKKEDSPLRKKPPKEIQKPKPQDPIQQTAAIKTAPRKIDVRPRLQFELNAKLPSAPTDLIMPSLEHFSMEMPTLKNIYDLSELDAGLMALVKIPPVYPVRAQRREIEGFVTIEFLVTEQGLVKDLQITKAEPERIFNNAVINCVSRWKFKPPTVEGIPVTAKARTTINFQLQE